MPVGTSFMQVTAADPDEGPNAVVDYFFDEADAYVKLDKFRLDRTSGTLRINQPLDREDVDSYILPIIARDRGSPPLTTTTTVTVNLLDVNDNPPKFEQSSYDLWIAENSPAGSLVGTLVAKDPDADENAEILFKVFGGSDAKLFELEADASHPGTVRILSRQEFDYEAKTNKFFVELQASSGQLSSTVPVTIHVSDQNDNQPQLRDFVVLYAAYGDDRRALTVGRMPAFDPDQNATLEHYLEPNDIIAVEGFSGELVFRNYWRRQIDVESKACVSDGPNTVCATCHTSYVYVDESLLRESISLHVADLSPDEFLDVNAFRRFQSVIATLHDTWMPEDIRIFSVAAEEHSEKRMLNISFFVAQGEEPVR
ncbi:Protein FMI-1 [Aphelenchoides avenae]|nr:Protein FMI-1 [Aphelenchus avenae]